MPTAMCPANSIRISSEFDVQVSVYAASGSLPLV